MYLYNSLSQSKVPFEIEGNSIRWYSCGPTVYDHSHIGHARNYVGFDIIRRIFEDYLGYHVTQVLNITDIDDKIVKRAKDEGKTIEEVAKKWEKEFLDDMKVLGVKPPTTLTRVTEYIPEIINFISVLIDKGTAYVQDGSVYFKIKEYSEKHTYGKFVSCVDHEGNFALWKADQDFWDSPWGKGRPGWHIECSVMATCIFGSELEIHTGGEDLKFPHHENEIAQCEAFYDKSWVKYFLHSGHLHIDGSKMSKSLKNFITIKQALSKYSPRELRMLFLLHPINKVLEYNQDSMNYAKSIDNLFDNLMSNLVMEVKSITENKWEDQDKLMNQRLVELRIEVDQAIKDNFDTRTVIQLMQEMSIHINRYLKSKPKLYLVQEIYGYYQKIFNVFGMNYTETVIQCSSEIVDELVNYRSEVRSLAKKFFTLSDQLRDDVLPNLGIRLIDKGNISSWKYS
jgi:cysteinyl-tRNA synthetase